MKNIFSVAINLVVGSGLGTCFYRPAPNNSAAYRPPNTYSATDLSDNFRQCCLQPKPGYQHIFKEKIADAFYQTEKC